MVLTEQKLKQCIPTARDINIRRFTIPLNVVMEKYSINTSKRICCFLAQVAHESGSFEYVKEIASGKAYENRLDLGNTFAGDGVRYKGRGLIQVTGRFNYTDIAKDLSIDCINNPQILEQAEYATLTAGWFWNKKKLNSFADNIVWTEIEKDKNFIKITKLINGGLNGYEDRLNHLINCQKYIIDSEIV